MTPQEARNLAAAWATIAEALEGARIKASPTVSIVRFDCDGDAWREGPDGLWEAFGSATLHPRTLEQLEADYGPTTSYYLVRAVDPTDQTQPAEGPAMSVWRCPICGTECQSSSGDSDRAAAWVAAGGPTRLVYPLWHPFSSTEPTGDQS